VWKTAGELAEFFCLRALRYYKRIRREDIRLILLQGGRIDCYQSCRPRPWGISRFRKTASARTWIVRLNVLAVAAVTVPRGYISTLARSLKAAP